MNIKQELEYARGMVERRRDIANAINAAESAREAKENHRSVLGALKEVLKHRKNIMSLVDDTTAGYALEVEQLLGTVNVWREQSALVLAGWGVPENELRLIEQQVGGL